MPRITAGTSARLLRAAVISTCSQQICCAAADRHPALREDSRFQTRFRTFSHTHHNGPARMLMHQAAQSLLR